MIHLGHRQGHQAESFTLSQALQDRLQLAQVEPHRLAVHAEVETHTAVLGLVHVVAAMRARHRRFVVRHKLARGDEAVEIVVAFDRQRVRRRMHLVHQTGDGVLVE